MNKILVIFLILIAFNINAYGNTSSNGVNTSTQPKWLKDFNSAIKLYDEKKYVEAKKIFDDIIPLLTTKIQIIEARFKNAYCSFYDKDYIASKYQFEIFYDSYKNTEYTEEALFMLGKSLYMRSPSIHFSSFTTKDAIQIFRLYLNRYENGKFVKESLKLLNELEEKVFKKAIYIAKIYYNLSYYKSAIVTLKNIFEEDFRTTININLIMEAKWVMINNLYHEAILSNKYKDIYNAFNESLNYKISYPENNPYKKRIIYIYNILDKKLN